MPNKARASGDYFERRTKATLEWEGMVVLRSAGSLGPADLVALKQGQPVWLVSCKKGHGMRPAERMALCTTAARAGALPLLASPGQRGWLMLEVVSPQGYGETQLVRMPPTRKKKDG